MWIVSGLVGCVMVYTFFTTTGRWWKLVAAFLAGINFMGAYQGYSLRGEELTTHQIVLIGVLLYLAGVWTTSFITSATVTHALVNLRFAKEIMEEQQVERDRLLAQAEKLGVLLARAARLGITPSDRSKESDGKDNKTNPSL